ncbi:MAG: sulfite exporter TauE/SafE family protein [Clostridia bacterium]|nr:sulfite exporter TauE/SafE family protein [Clostridia bacterium]
MKWIEKELHISGMTCPNCEHVIQKGLSSLNGLKKAEVSYQRGIAKIVFDSDQISLDRIENTVKALGYDVPAEKSPEHQHLRRTIFLPLAIIAAYALLEHFGILNLLVPGQLAQSSMGYGMLFVTGLLTSVHCIAMCGGISLSQCLPIAVQKDARYSSAAFLPALLYNLGRVVSYTIIGFLLGLTGLLLGKYTGTGPSIMLQGAIKLLAGAVMVIMGVNMLGIFPWLRRLNLRIPGFAAKWIKRMKTQQPFIVGLFNGLMPCGPLQSMQILALASGSPVAGALSMMMFSLGTVPLMLGLGAFIAALGKRFAREVMHIGAVLIAVLGLAMIAQGGSLAGLFTPGSLLVFMIGLFALSIAASIPFSRKAYRVLSMTACLAGALLLGAVWHFLVPSDALEPFPSSSAGGVQIVKSTLYPWQYPTITVQAGTPVKWTIHAEAKSINGCNEIMVLPEYEIIHGFTEGDNIIEFTPEQAGTYPYSCWMGMIRGSIIVN